MNLLFISPARSAIRSGFLFVLLLPLTLAAQKPVPVPPTVDDASNREDEVVKLSVFNVSAENDKGYGATNSIAGSRINVPIREIPSYMITLNEQFLKDLGTVDMLEALNYVSGVRTTAQGQGTTQYSLRGYVQDGSGTVYRDGLPDRDSSVDVSPNDPATYDRIEILKGPAGVLYGSHNLGGVVNRVSKMPRSKRQTLVEFNASSGWDEFLRGMVDTTGPIDTAGQTAYRLVFADRRGERAWGGKDNRLSALGVLRRTFGAQQQTRVWGRFYYYRTEINRDQGWNFVDMNGELPTFFKGDGRDHVGFPLDAMSNGTTRAFEIGAETSFKAFGSDWSVRLLARTNDSDGDKSPSYAGGTVTALDAAGKRLGTNAQIAWTDPRVADWRTTLTVRDFQGFIDQSGIFLDLVGKIDVGPTNHTLILNGSTGEGHNQRVFYFWQAKFANAPAALPNTYSLLPAKSEADLRGVNYGTISANDTKKFNAFQNESEGRGQAFGVQDSIAILDRRLIGVIGARFDKSSSTAYTLNADLARTAARESKDSNWTYKYGLVGEPIRGVSIFAHHSTTFNPINAVDPSTGKTFPNQEGKIDELGAKLELFGRRLIGTASVFDMSLTNIIIQVVNPPELGGGTRPQAVGVQKTKGWETDLAWQPVDGLSLLVGYSDLTSVNEQNNPFRGVPQTPTYSFYSKYIFQTGTFQDIGFGIGYQHNGKRAGDAVNSFTEDETDQFDMSLSFEPRRRFWDVQLNVVNVTDAQGIMGSVSTTIISTQIPRTFRVTFRYRF